jgi:squalene synthase HpnC
MLRRTREVTPGPLPSQVVLATDRAPAGEWSVERSYAYCESFTRARHENFPIGRFIPADLRRHVFCLYAFARTADDFADEPSFEGRRREALDRWENDLERCFHGEAEHPVFVALRDTIERRDIPITPLADLLTSFRMDLSVRRYATFTDLLGYCARSANPVGRALLYLFGYREPSLHALSDEVCTALELTNLLQDVALDLRRDRIYLPQEDLAHFGVTEKDLFSNERTRGFRELMRYEVSRTRALYQRGRPLLSRVGPDLAFELRLIWLGGMHILNRLQLARYDVWRRRPSLGRTDKAYIAAHAAAWQSLAIFGTGRFG